MKTILVPTDFSDVAENAADYAAELAKMTKAKIIFYNTFTMPVPIGDIPPVTVPIEEMEKQGMKLLQAFDKRIKGKHGKLETQLLTEPGFVVEGITEYTKKHKIDLIVMGVTGAGKTPGILGSNAASVMQHVSSPVLVVPKNYKYKKPATMALACDYDSILPDEPVNKLKFFIRLFNPKVMVFNVLKPTELATYQKAATEVNMENSLSDIEHSLHFPSSKNLPEEINHFVDEHTVDMLVMFPHSYNFLKGLLHHSATKEMAFLTHVPLLSIHE